MNKTPTPPATETRSTAANRTHSFEARKPARAFVWFLKNIDGSFDKHRLTMDDYRELVRTAPGNRPLAGHWAYEQSGEAGIYPTGEEWSAIHGDDGCATPCAKCEAHGYDPRTGKTKGGAR